jgi:CHAT domain-containing protein/Tfp pilus assembly protein PilF
MRRLACILLLLSGCARQSPDSIYRKSKTLLDRGEWKPALAAADEGFRREPSWRFRLLKAEILLSNGDAPAALEVLRAADPPESDELSARLAMHRGQAKYLLSDYAGSELDLNRAREISNRLHQPLLDAEIELRRGALLVRRGRTQSAEESFRSVLQTAAAHDDFHLQVDAMGNLGFLFLNIFRYDEAIYWLNRARDGSEKLGRANSVARALGNLGWCYHRLGDDEQALKYMRDAEKLFRSSGNRYEQQAWTGNIGDVLLDESEYSSAAKQFTDALAMGQNSREQYWRGTWLSNLATASIGAQNFDAAERYNDEALRLSQGRDSGFEVYARLNRARIEAGRNDVAGAETLYHTLLGEPSDDPTPMIEAESELAELLVKKGDATSADAQFRAALAMIERQRSSLTRDEYKLSYLSSLIQFYQRYVDFLVASGQEKKALEAAESSRALVLDEKLHNRGASARDVDATVLQQFARSSNSILLSYWLAPERSFLWVVTPTAVTLHTLPPEKKIAALVEAYGSLLENLRDPLDSESPAGRDLSRILLGPVQGLLKPGEHIVMVPDRVLHSLNFETLPDPDQPSRYLIESATISIAPSLGGLTNAGARAAQFGNSILLIGDPEPAVEEYQRLPYAAKEIALIEQSFAAGNSGPPASRRSVPLRSVVIEGAHAYPAAYRDSDPARFSFIHFAAHATTNRESPLDSALILSRHESGYALSARDVMNVPLHADLVTLSACRSAGARTYSGEGLVGLSWAFLRAGARNVVAGLWDVNDMSTANLMADFYSRLTRGAAPPDALREAKLELVHSSGAYRKPFYWGPFQVYTGAAK